MIYIPRFKKRTRLDTRGGGSPNVPAVSGEAVRLEAMSKVLDQVATKILPVALSLNEEEELEQNKTFINDIRTNVSDRFKEAPVNPSQEWYDSNIQPIYDEAKKNDRYTEGVAKRIDNIFKEKSYVYNNRIVDYKLKTVGVQKQKNLMDSLKQDIMEADASNKLSIDAIYDARLSDLTENMVWEQETRTGKKLTNEGKKELIDRADISQRIDNFDTSFKELIKGRISQEIKDLPEDIPLDEKIEIIEGTLYPKSEVQFENSKYLKEKSGAFNFLDTAKFYELDDEKFSEQLVSEVFKIESLQNKREARLKEELSFDDRDQINTLKQQAKAFAVAGKEKEYNDIKDELEERYPDHREVYIKPFSAATNSTVKAIMAKQQGEDKAAILKKMAEDPDYFAGDYLHKEKQLKDMGIIDPSQYINFVGAMDRKEAVKVRAAIKSSYRHFNIFNTALSKKAPGESAAIYKENIKLGMKLDEIPYQIRIEALNKNYISKMKVLETEMTDALASGDTSGFNDNNANGFIVRAKAIFNEEIYEPYKSIIEESIQEQFVTMEIANMDGGDGGLSKAFSLFMRDFDKDETTKEQRDKIINDLSRSLDRQIALEDDQRKTLNMVSKALPVLKRIKEVSDLERVAREVNKKQKTTIGQITN